MILSSNAENTLPEIVFEEMQGTISIKGRSISHEVDEFFDVFLPYLKENLQKNPMDITVDIDLEYFNTKSARLLLEFFKIIESDVYDKKFNATINWHMDYNDDDIMEAAEDYESMTKLDFNYIIKD